MEEGLVMETRQEARHAADTDLVTDAQYVFWRGFLRRPTYVSGDWAWAGRLGYHLLF